MDPLSMFAALRTPSFLRILREFNGDDGQAVVRDMIFNGPSPALLDQIIHESMNVEQYPLTPEENLELDGYLNRVTANLARQDFYSSVSDMLSTGMSAMLQSAGYDTVVAGQLGSGIVVFMTGRNARTLPDVINAIESFLGQVPSSNVHPASAETIAALPSEATLVVEEVCFCSRDREVGELYDITTLPCQHKFDTECIREWLRRCNTCPNCRYPLFTGNPRIDQEVSAEQLRRMDPGVD